MNQKHPKGTRSKRLRPYVKKSDILATDPAAALYDRAKRISFEVHQEALWVHESVPDHGDRCGPLVTAQPITAGDISVAIADYLCRNSIIPPTRSFRFAIFLTAEVIPFLRPGWKLTADNLLRFLRRRISGRDLVLTSRDP